MLVLELWPERHTYGLVQTRGLKMQGCQGQKSVHTVLALSLTPGFYYPRKEFLYLAPAPFNFFNDTQGTGLHYLAVVASKTCGPTELYTFAYFKSCYLRVCLPKSLNLGAKNPPPPPQAHDRSWHTFKYWEPPEIKQLAWTITKV